MPNMDGEIAAYLVLYGDGSWVACATEAEAEYYLATPQGAVGKVRKTVHSVKIVPLADWVTLKKRADDAESALRQVADLADSEADEPLDDAIRIAEHALIISSPTP